MQLQPYQHQREQEILAFVKSNYWVTEWPELLLTRFLRELTSSTDLVFDLFQDGQRVATAVLVDKIKNPANDANFEMLAIHPSIDPETAYSFILPLAKERLPERCAGISLGFPSEFAEQSAIVHSHALTKNYEMFDMQNRALASYAKAHNQEFSLVQVEDDEAVYKALTAAFAQNPDTSIPGFTDWQTSRKRDPSQRTWIKKEGGAVIAFLTLYPNREIIEIGTVGVLPKYRGRGYARQLIEHALDYAATSGFKECKLSVAVQNERALSLYRKLGFEPNAHHLVYRWKRM